MTFPFYDVVNVDLHNKIADKTCSACSIDMKFCVNRAYNTFPVLIRLEYIKVSGHCTVKSPREMG